MKVKNKLFMYLVEGESEKKLVKHLKETNLIMNSRRPIVLPIHQNPQAWKAIQNASEVDYIVCIYDNDHGMNWTSFEENCKQIIKNYSVEILILLSHNDLEDELMRVLELKTKTELYSLFNSENHDTFVKNFIRKSQISIDENNVDKLWINKSELKFSTKNATPISFIAIKKSK